MNMRTNLGRNLLLVAVGLPVLLLGSATGLGHCDTMDGPVVADAKIALEKSDVTGVLKWIPQESEAELRQAFDRTLAVRTKGPQARELADLYFFETLVRLHRAGEGEPYTGLEPAGSEVSPVVAKADQALQSGSVDTLAKEVAADVEAGIRRRFAAAAEAQKHATESIEAGRKFVAAYVEFVHYAEALHQAAAGQTAYHSGPAEGTPAADQQSNPPAKTHLH